MSARFDAIGLPHYGSNSRWGHVSCVVALFTVLAFAASAIHARAQSLDTFGVLAGSAITNTGPTVINGNIGVSPGSAISGFPPGVVVAPYASYSDAVAQLAQDQLTTLYNVLSGRPATQDLTGQDLGGLTLTPGVYTFATAAQLTGTLTLDGLNDPNAVFIFNIGSSLTTASNSVVALTNQTQGANVFFRVGSSATLGVDTLFNGEIVALTAITLTTGADITCGAALARNAAVTLDTNVINICPLAAVVIGPELPPDTPPVVVGVGDAIDDAGGGTLPIGFQALGLLTPAELAAALAQLAGEAGAGVLPAGTQSMDSFMNLMLTDDRGPGVVSLNQPDTVPGQGTVSVMGYAAEGSDANSPFASFDRGHTLVPPDRRLNVWAGGYGDLNHIRGDAALGTHDVSSHDLGLAAGIDYRLSGDSKVGFSVGGGVAKFDLSDGFGGGSLGTLQAGAYAQKNIGDAYLLAALGYAYDDVTTSRTLTFAGTDNLTAHFGAQSLVGRFETGYKMDWFTPYAALRGQAFLTPAYSETAASGASTFALNYAARAALSARSEVGVRMVWTTDLDNDATLTLRTSIAWAHDLWSDGALRAEFQALPGSPFTVQGALPAADSALLSAGMDFSLHDGVTLAGAFNGAFAQNAQSYGGTVRLNYNW